MHRDAAGRMLLLFGVLLAGTAPLALTAQVAFVAHGLGSVSVDVDDQDAASGAGFGFMAGAGIRLRNLEFGGEYGQHGLGDDRKAKQYGGWIRVFATGPSRVRLFLVAGIADYRYSPASGSRSRSVGGSVGPGVIIPLGSARTSLLLEARFHSGFDRLGVISSQEFLSISAGVRLAP
jgi:hypothetical protein